MRKFQVSFILWKHVYRRQFKSFQDAHTYAKRLTTKLQAKSVVIAGV